MSADRPLLRIGKYIILRTLGRGGMSLVQLAMVRETGDAHRLVVLKRLFGGAGDITEVRGLREARIAGRLSHPNVISIFDVEVIDGEVVLAMEYLEGVALSEIARACALRNSRVPIGIALHVLRQVLSGLSYAHGLREYDGTPLGLIHRDVSPHNVHVTYDGHVKLLDFGIAKATMGGSLTALGIVKGKLAYMAPEQAMGAPLDRRADLFAVGVMLWELVSGHRFAVVRTPMAALCERATRPSPPIRARAPDVDDDLAALVDRAVAREADERFPTAAEMSAALESYAARRGLGASHEDVARFVASLFAEYRHFEAAELRSQCARALGLTATVGARAGRLPPRASGSREEEIPAGDRTSSIATVTAPTVRARVRRGWMVLGAFAVGIGAFVAWEALPRGPTSRSLSVVSPEAKAEGDARPSTREGDAKVSVHAAERASTLGPLPGAEAGVEKPSRRAAPFAAPIRPRASHDPLPRDGGADAAAAAVGFVTLDTTPWSVVSVDGQSYGPTPVVHLALRPGIHSVTVSRRDLSIGRQFDVVVREGETVARRWMLE